MSIKPSQPVTVRSLEQRIANQRHDVNVAVKSGRMSEAEGKKAHQQLDTLKARVENDAFDGNGLSRGKALDHALDTTRKSINSLRGDEHFDVKKGVTDIERRIQSGIADGSLTKAEARTLSFEAAVLKEAMSSARTPFEKAVVRELTKAVSADVAGARHDGDVNQKARLASFESRIAHGVADGSLTKAEGEKLRSQLGELAGQKKLDAKSMNALSRTIYDQRHDAQVEVPRAAKGLDAAIDRAAKQGRLTPDEASALKASLRDITGDGGPAAGARLNGLREEFHARLDPAPRREPAMKVTVGVDPNGPCW